MTGLENIQGFKQILISDTKAKKAEAVKLENKPDSFEKTDKKGDKSSNGKFDVSECIKNFVKGVFSPLTAVVKHPIMTIGVVAATAAACTLVPVLGPITAIGFGALSVFQLGKGVVDVVKNYKNGDYDKAEKSFNEVGQGTVGVAMGALGIKQSAKVAKEAKLMSELGITSLDKAQKAQIAQEVSNGTTLNAFKEVCSLFTTKAGLKAVSTQFKPSNILARGKEAFKFLTTKEEVTKVEGTKRKFAETAEGKKRASMTTEEIEAEVKALYKEACDEYGIPEELRPEIKITKANIKEGGGYSSSKHTITINENSYREGCFDLPDVIKHEATHAKEAILRQRLPQEDKERLAVEYLLDKIQNGEKENIVTGGNIFCIDTAKPPKLNSQMKADFSKLAQEKLYTTTQYSEEELIAMVRPMVEANPEFIQSFDNADDALKAMTNYAKSHNFRYNLAMHNSSGFNTANIDTGFLTELSEEEKIVAIKSFKNGIDCIESNAANNKLLGIGGDFNQYQFTPEEVLAQQEGNTFEIAKLEKQLKNLRATENYDLTEEARLLDQIKKSELTIEYKTKGQKMYELYTQLLQDPNNTELAQRVKSAQEELTIIQNKINNISGLYADNMFGSSAYVEVLDYTTHKVLVKPEMGVSHNIPISTTNAADIIADNIEEE